MLNKLVVILQYAVGGGGLFYAIGLLHTNANDAAALASLSAVGVVGTLGFMSHVLLHEQDAKRIGFSAKTASFQYEVGFANLAFGVAAFISYFAHWGIRADTVLLLAYALYLLQAGLLHVYTGRANKKVREANFRRAALTFVFCGAMLYVALQAILSSAF